MQRRWAGVVKNNLDGAKLSAVQVAAQMSHGPIIAAAVGVAVFVLELAGNAGMTEFLVSGWIGGAAKIKVAMGSVDSVVVAALLVVAELRRRCIPGALDLVHLADDWGRRGRRLGTHHVGDGRVIATAEALAVGIADFRRSTGIAIFVAVVDVGAAMVIEVAVCAFDAVMEAAALNVAEFARGCIPAVSVLGDAEGRRRGGHGIGRKGWNA